MTVRFTDQTLLAIATHDADLVDWKCEWADLFLRYRALEDKFEALSQAVAERGESPDDIPALCLELAELSGESVCYKYWQHHNGDKLGNATHELWSAKANKHFGETKTLAEAESNFRAEFSRPEMAQEVKEESP